MSNPKGNTLPNAISIFLVMLAVYCIDIFLFKSDLTVLGDAFYSRFISFAILTLYIWASKDSPSVLGISKKKEKFTAGVFYGIIFSVIPLFLVTAAECVYYGFTDLSAIDLNFSPPSLNYVRSEENLTPVAAVVIYLFTTFLASAFKEFFFRGFMLKKLKKVMSFGWANIIQSALYMSFTLVLLLRNLINGYYDDTTSRLGAFIIAFYIIHETLAGVKWGLMTRVSGSTYIATVDHFLYVFLSNSIFITNRYVTWSFMTHMLAIQVVSTLLTLVYYKLSMKKINEKKARKAAREEAERLEIEARRKERKEKSIKKKTDGIEEISPENFKRIIRDSERGAREILSDEEILQNKKSIEYTLTNPIEDVNADDSEIDNLLKSLTREMSGNKHRDSREITDDFDADDFLKDYNKHGGDPHRHSHHHHHHHHRSHTEPVKKEQKPTPKPKQEPKKELAKKPKLTFTQKLQSLGGIDDSSSNDLI